MTSPTDMGRLSFFATPIHRCSYLPDHQAVTVFADPAHPKDSQLYSTLSRYGFRRSGTHIYRPRCPDCDACVPVRLPVADFKPRRSQRRIWRRNQDLRIVAREANFDPEHFALYRAYLSARHPDGGMDDPSPQQYMEFLTSNWADTVFFELRLGPRLLGVAVSDVFEDGLSAVYTFFDPREQQRGLGVFSILWEVEEARRRGLSWLYLGYWIDKSDKMKYKADYQPLEYYLGGHWVRKNGQSG